MSTTDLALMEASLVGAPDPDIVALEVRLRAAQLAADVEALDALISSDLLFTGPDGRLGGRRRRHRWRGRPGERLNSAVFQ